MISRYRTFLLLTLLAIMAAAGIPQPVHADVIPVTITSNTVGVYSTDGVDTTAAAFQWTVGTRGTIIGSTTAATVTVEWDDVDEPTTGTLSVQVLTEDGDTGTTTLTVSIYPRPVIAISGDFAVCSGETQVYSASDSRNTGSTFGWSVSGGTIVGAATGATVAVQWSSANAPALSSLHVVGYEPHGFNGSSAASVTVYPNPVLLIAGDSNVCSSETTVYTASDAHATGITSFVWTVQGGVIQGAADTETVAVLWPPVTQPTPRTITVMGAGENGCADTTNYTVTVYPNPALAISGDADVCSEETATYAVIDSNSTNITSLVWTVEGGVIQGGSTGDIITVEWNIVDTITIRTITVMGAGANGCADATAYYVMVYPNPVLLIAGDSNVCSSETTVYTASDAHATGITSFVWTVDGGVILGAADTETIAVLWDNVNFITTRTITVMGAGANGCADTTSYTVTVYPTPVLVVSGNTNICSEETATYAVVDLNTTNIASYTWTVEGGTILGSTDKDTVTVLWNNSSAVEQRFVSVSGTGTNGCTSSDSLHIHPPVAANAGADVTICAGSVVQLQATGGVSYSWSPATGLSNPNIANPTVSPSTTTTYTVTVANPGGCMSTDTITVAVAPVELHIALMLEGAYNGATMNSALGGQGLLPAAQPFNTAPFHYAGTETIVPPAGNTAVDWVLVELRSHTPGSIVARKAALLYTDGTIGDAGGTGTPTIADILPGSDSLYAVVWHRNHLPVMSNIRIAPGLLLDESVCTLHYNFIGSQSAAYAQFINAQKQFGISAVYGLVGGDVNGDGIVNAVDRVMINNASGQAGYLAEDISLDGIVNAVDRVIVRTNRFYVAQVPQE